LSLIAPVVGSATLYESPKGHADWTGVLPEPNAARSDGPLPNMAAARNLIRTHRIAGEWLDEAITVWIRGGTYFLDDRCFSNPAIRG